MASSKLVLFFLVILTSNARSIAQIYTSKRLYLEHEICIDTEPGAVVIIGVFLNCHLHQQTSASYCQQPTSAAYRIQHGLARLLHSFLLSIQVVQCELPLCFGCFIIFCLWENSSCKKRNSSGLNQHTSTNYLPRYAETGLEATLHLVQVQVTSLGKSWFREISYIFRVPLFWSIVSWQHFHSTNSDWSKVFNPMFNLSKTSL